MRHVLSSDHLAAGDGLLLVEPPVVARELEADPAAVLVVDPVRPAVVPEADVPGSHTLFLHWLPTG